jgi:hypothetical protein
MDADVRTGQVPCPAGYYCENGLKIPFLSWTDATTCSAGTSTVTIAITEAVNALDETDVRTFEVIKNGDISSNVLELESQVYETYSVVDQNPDNTCPLTIDQFSFADNQMKITGAIDYELCKDGVTVGVRATGQFTNCNTGSTIVPCASQISEICHVDLRIINLNEPPAWLDTQFIEPTEPCYMADLSFEIDEKTLEFTEFGENLETCVTDPDESDTITFSILDDSSVGWGLIDVRDCGGKLFVKEGADLRYVCAPDSPQFVCGENPANTVSVQVVASDLKGLTSTKAVQVKLINVNDAPYFDSSVPTTFEVDENEEKGFSVTDVVFAIDDDNDRLSYTLENRDGEDVLILAADGSIITNEIFDFEVKAAYYFTLTVTDNDPTTIPATSPLYKLQIRNKNDKPYFAGDISSVEYIFPETVPGESAGSTTVTNDRIANIVTLGADQDVGDVLTYTLTADDGTESADFELLSVGSDVFIVVKRDTDVLPFDFEGDENEFSLELTVSDGTVSTDPINVVLKLSNVNEPPSITDSASNVKVMESVCAANEYVIDGKTYTPTQNGEIVHSIETFDQDAGQETYMSITNVVPFVVSAGRSCEVASLGCTRFEMSLTGVLNSESVSSYTVDLEISDGQKKSTGSFNVEVLDCNERPVLVNNVIDRRFIHENNETVVRGPKIAVIDADTNDSFEYKIVGGTGQFKFVIDNEGQISTMPDEDTGESTYLDYESAHEYSVTVLVTDVPSAPYGGPAASTAVSYEINVIDQNEPPDFERYDTTDEKKPSCFGASATCIMKTYTFSITESTKAEDIIGRITGTDPDMLNPTLEYLRYTFAGHDYLGADCTIPDGGSATNGRGQSCCLSQEVLEIEYQTDEVADSTGLFVIKEGVGTPFANMGGCLLQARVDVTDAQGLTSAEKAFVFLNISGTNQSPECEDQTFGHTSETRINENPAPGTVIIPGNPSLYAIQAIDPDVGQSLKYRIHNEMQDWDTQIASVYRPKFEMDEATGALSVTEVGASSLDFETHPILNITVIVVDDDNPPLFDFADIKIVLSDVNEKPSFRSFPRVEISELANNVDNDVDFAAAMDLSAVDVDAIDVASLVFSVVCSSCDNPSDVDEDFPFGITTHVNGVGVQNSGRLYLKKGAKIDHEGQPVYSVSVKVTDSAGNHDEKLIEIHIKDENESPTWVEPGHEGSAPGSHFEFSFEENSSGGTVVGNVAVVDPENDAIIYDVVDASGKFEVSTTGQLRTFANASFDFEDIYTYTLEVSATESGRDPAFSVTQNVVVRVIDINDMYIEAVGPQNLLTAGGEQVMFSGKNFGPISPGIAVEISAIYYGSDNIIYVAKDCEFVEPGDSSELGYKLRDNTMINCTTVGGVGRNHEWNITVTASNTVPWTVVATIDRDLHTSYDPPEVFFVENADDMPTSGGQLVTLTGINFGPKYKFCGPGLVCENYPLIPGVSKYACEDKCILDKLEDDPDYLSADPRPCTLEGVDENFGLACDRSPEMYISDAVEVYYGPSEDDDQKYQCKDARVIESGVKVTCLSAEGVGSGFWWKVKVGSKDPNSGAKLTDQTSQYSVPSFDYPGSSYKPPRLDRALAPLLPNNAATDSEQIQFYGDNFGIDGGEITVTYGGENADKYASSNCVMVVPHKSFNCSSVPGVGKDLKFKMTVSELTSASIITSLAYDAPVIFPPDGMDIAVLGQGALDAKTSGGQEISLFGLNFGPQGDLDLPSMSYGPLETLGYVAKDCYVSNSFNKITCTSVAGTGFGHYAQVEVGGQLSDVYDADIAYARPSVHYFEPQWEKTIPIGEGGRTPGNEWIIIHGENFGMVEQNAIDRISYGPNGVEYHPCLGPHHEHCSCDVIVDHTEIRCNTTVGSGKQHRWVIKIDGQNSTVSTTSYDRPSVESITGEGAEDALADGGQRVTITGKNFGPSQGKLESVTYGPSGQEFVAVNCVYVSHYVIECDTSPGLGGELKWLVTVDEQTSDLSTVTTNYKRPTALRIEENYGMTKGGSTHRIIGDNLGVNVMSAFVEVLFDTDTIELAPGVIRSIVGTSSSYLIGRNSDGTDYVDFSLPQMLKLHQMKTVELKVGHKVFNVEQFSNDLAFNYNEPFIDTVENIEVDPIMGQPTTDLVIRGLNFGLDDYAKIYIDNVLQTNAESSATQGINSWDHEVVKVKYIGSSGAVYVKVGEFLSNVVPFNKSSPILIMQEPFVAQDAGYTTRGVGADGSSQLTLAGCHFQSREASIKIYIGGVECPIVTDSLIELLPDDEVFSEYDIDLSFCSGSSNKIRKITCDIPEGTGANNEIVLKRGGNPNYSNDGTLNLRYLPPRVDSYNPLLVSTKGGVVTIVGDNFGDNVNLVTVHMGTRELVIDPATFGHTSMEVAVPAGEGRRKDVMITVDGQKYVSSKDDDDVFGYYVPIIDDVDPNEIDTTGATVQLTGQYFGREGGAIVSLVKTDGSGGYAELPFEVVVSAMDHDSMTLQIGEGQGASEIAVNVSGNVAYADLSYKVPSIDVPASGELIISTNGGEEVLLSGLNFGIGSDYTLEIREKSKYDGSTSVFDEDEGGNKKIFPMQLTGLPAIKEFSHTGLTLITPEGQNQRDDSLELVLKVAGQDSNVISFNYGKPTITNVTMCFAAATQLVYELECVKNDDDLLPPLWSDCDPYDGKEGGCGLNTDGGYTLALFGENFGSADSGVQSVYFGSQRLVHESENVPGTIPLREVHFVSHNEIHIKVPAGVGMDIPITVHVGDRMSEGFDFAYDPPFVEEVTPEFANAAGDTITINGVNFGSTLEMAGAISVRIGQTKYDDDENDYVHWVDCPPPVYGDREFPIWQQKGSGSPYLFCQLPEVTVGPKYLQVSVAGRNITLDRDDSGLSPKCVATFYGQKEDAIFWGPNLDMCADECDLASELCMDSWDPVHRNHSIPACENAKHCVKIVDLNGDIKNCTVITREDEYCVPCPGGASCEANTQYDEEPISMEGYWRRDVPATESNCGEDDFSRRDHRTHCYAVEPCQPFTACVGDNKCAYGYTGEKCVSCCDMMHRYTEDEYGRSIPNPECYDDDGDQIKYFRQYGECAPCPSNPWMIVAILVGGATFGGSIAYIMKKNRVSLGIFSIAVDYLQILALLSATKTPWPKVILTLYTWLSAFNFNINITAPECAFELAYEDKWKMIMVMPGFLLGLVVVYNVIRTFLNKVVLNKHGPEIYAHSHKSVGMVVTILYYIYLSLSMNALEVFNCSVVELEDPLTGEIVSDGKQYMSETNWVCYEEGSLQMSLVPYACVGLAVYTVGYPAFCAFVLMNAENARLARGDQILRADDEGFEKPQSREHRPMWEFRMRYGKLYYYFKPSKWYWVLVVLFRKFSIATISLMFRANATFQMCMIVLAIFLSAVVQVKNQPYMSMAERDEVKKEGATFLEAYREAKEKAGGNTYVGNKKKVFNLGDATPFEMAEHAADYFWNYNTVETVLLSSSILVNLFGIMFESQFLREGSPLYELLANTTLVVIFFSLIYVSLVVWSEIVTAVFPTLKCTRLLSCLFNNQHDAEDITKAQKDSEIGMELKDLEFSSNPMFAGAAAASDLDLSEEDMVKVVKTHPEYIKLAETVKGLAAELRDAKKKASEGGGENKSAKFKMLVHKAKKGFDNDNASSRKGIGGLPGVSGKTLGGGAPSGSASSLHSEKNDGDGGGHAEPVKKSQFTFE